MNEIFNQEDFLGDVSSNESGEDIVSVDVSAGDSDTGADVSAGDSSPDVSAGDVSGSDVSNLVLNPATDSDPNYNIRVSCSCGDVVPLWESSINDFDTTDGLLLLILCVLLFMAFVRRR